MPTLTRSPLAFAKTALGVAEQSLPKYSCPKSKRTYTQHQLFAILALRDFFNLKYRGITQMLAEWSDLRQALGIEKVPHFTTLFYAEERLLKKGASQGS